MKKNILLAIFALATAFKGNSQTTAAAKAQGVGANVSVRGVVINGSELGIIRYIQDNTGGIAAYGSPVASLNKGDSVVVSGPLTEFYNLYEISPPVVNLISNNGKLFAPEVVTPAQFGEAQEGKLIKILKCTFNATGNFSTTATNYTVTSNSQTFAVRSNTLLAGTPIPTGTVDIIGVGSQFCGPQSSSGCTTGYQLLPRTTADFVVSSITGIESKTSEGMNIPFTIFPNPIKNSIHLNMLNEFKINLVTISDVLGNILYQAYHLSNETNVEFLPVGVYYISITTDSNIYKTKFIKE